jgi:hypothetical protein
MWRKSVVEATPRNPKTLRTVFPEKVSLNIPVKQMQLMTEWIG